MTSRGGGPRRSNRSRDVRAKRIYEKPSPDDGYRVLIDHIWPRGISSDRARLDSWVKELAPSAELRKCFDHVPSRFESFRIRYRRELAAHADILDELLRRTGSGPLTILYAARDQEHNNAVVLVELLRGS
jgi:uncharacterized protein YeaO (DUF488 family)